MPAARSLHTYPDALWSLVEHVATKRETQVIIGVDRRFALGMRQRFYSFRKALGRDEGERAQMYYKWANEVVLLIKGESQVVDLHFMHKELTPMAQMFAAHQATGQMAPLRNEGKVADVGQRLLEELQNEANELKPKTERNYG